MTKFIKLTDFYKRKPTYINMDNVIEVEQFDNHTQVFFVSGDKESISVQETCEEIMDLIG